MTEQSHSGQGNNIGGDQTNIGRQSNLGDHSTYIEQQNISGESKIDHCLTAPPFIPSVFEGREADLTAVQQRLFANKSRNILLLVNGDGGIGKSSLAAKYWDSYQDEYQHTAWLFVQSTIQDALLSLALPLKLSFADNWTNKERLDVLLKAMANLGKPCLLILDNVNDKKNWIRILWH